MSSKRNRENLIFKRRLDFRPLLILENKLKTPVVMIIEKTKIIDTIIKSEPMLIPVLPFD